MTTEHPITPPPELVRQWAATNGTHYEDLATLLQSVATQAARWGADQELEACRKWVDAEFPTYPKCDGPASYRLADARRPKPPSLAEQALDRCNDYIDPDGIIRAALERLQELEKGNE